MPCSAGQSDLRESSRETPTSLLSLLKCSHFTLFGMLRRESRFYDELSTRWWNLIKNSTYFIHLFVYAGFGSGMNTKIAGFILQVESDVGRKRFDVFHVYSHKLALIHTKVYFARRNYETLQFKKSASIFLIVHFNSSQRFRFWTS